MIALRLVVFDMAGTTVDRSRHRQPRPVRRPRRRRPERPARGRERRDGPPQARGDPPAGRSVGPPRGPPRPGRGDPSRLRRADGRGYYDRYLGRRGPGHRRPLRPSSGDGVKVALDTGFDRGIARVIIDRLGWAGTPRCERDERRGRARPAPSRHDPASHGASSAWTTPRGGEGGRRAGRPGGRDQRRLRPGDRRDLGHAHPRPAPRVPSYPPGRFGRRAAPGASRTVPLRNLVPPARRRPGCDPNRHSS